MNEENRVEIETTKTEEKCEENRRIGKEIAGRMRKKRNEKHQQEKKR